MSPSSDPVTSDVRTEPTASERALREYRQRNRRAIRWYALIIVVLTVFGVGAVKLAYAHGGLDKVSRQSATAPSPVTATATSASLSLTWQTSDRAAGGTAYQDGIVVTFSGHTVNGRDALTGTVRWHYSRSDELLCAVVQQDATTIAIYRRKGNCDEVTGFATGTGQPKWYRTLVDDGPLFVSSAPNVVLAVSSSAVHVFDNASGLDRWRWTAPGACRVDRALAGSRGVLIAYTCGSQHHLTLHDLTSDSERWSVLVAEPFRPLTAGAAIIAVSASSGRAILLNAEKGSQRAMSLREGASAGPAAAGLPRSQATTEGVDGSSQPIEIASLNDLLAVGGDGSELWSAPSSSPAALIGDVVAARDGGAGVRMLRIADGSLAKRVTLHGAASDSAAVPIAVGAGLVLAGRTTEYFG